jgi:1-acyl-sn-glycerol-3-phosphate acyltransferase
LRVLPFKSSLFSVFFDEGAPADIAVQPVSVRYTPAPGRGLPANFYGWWGDMSFEGHIWDVVTRSWGGTVEVLFHPAVKVRGHADRKALADHCQVLVADGMQRLGVTAPSDMVQISD